MRRLLPVFVLPLLVACVAPSGVDPRLVAQEAMPQTDCPAPTLGGGESGLGYPGMPSAQSVLLGAWVDGHWEDSGACHAVVVEQISADGTVTATFSNGSTALGPPTARRVSGTVSSEGRLVLDLPDGSSVIYALDGAILRGAHVRDGVMRPVALVRG